jgi:hypothetical protein
MAEEKKDNLAMLGEFCREAAVLILVFGNLDIWLKALDRTWKRGTWPTILIIIATFIVASLFQTTGMFFEKWREK